ncbi:MAG: hypothetical protein KAX49_02720 [Halanaerobiales bacterium]|nr:hypothetical protein [Halanaerobiales bacterium]
MYTTKLYIPKSDEIMPSKRAYFFRAGFKGNPIVLDDIMRNLANSIYARGLEISEGRLFYKTMPIEEIPKLVNGMIIIPEIFKNIKSITFFVSTLGKKIDQAIEDYLAQQKVLQATLLDAWASEALEELNQSFDAWLRDQSGEGTRRFSPGYGDVDIRVNNFILDLLEVDSVCASLETGILLPRKSTVCMIGFEGGNYETK